MCVVHLNMPHKQCRSCNKAIRASPTPACKRCNETFHTECIISGIVLDEATGLVLCNPCLKVDYLQKVSTLEEKFSSLEEKCNSTTQYMANLEKLTQTIHNDYTALTAQIATIMEAQNRQPTIGDDILVMKENIKSEILKEQDSRMIELINELKLRDKKKMNLCVTGIHATDNTPDLTILKNLFTTRLGITNREVDKVSSCRRFSTKNNKPIIIVTFDCKEVRRNVLKNAIKLKNYRTSENTSVFISKDMTRQQQHEAYQLRNELKEQRARGNDVIIRNNKIVPKNPTSNVPRPRSTNVSLSDSSPPLPLSPPTPQARSSSPSSFSTPPSN